MSLRTPLERSLAASAALALGLAITAGTAGAEPPAHAGGPSADAGVVTEDHDGNDDGTPNNVVDDDDNLHPSGKDKSVEHGRSGNQGGAASDPDDDGRGPDRSNGGADVPDGPGGDDLADQDGNNGCGNDDDFEDDNEGWCGKPPATVPDTDVDTDTDTDTDVDTDTDTDTDVDSDTDTDVDSDVDTDTDVLPDQTVRETPVVQTAAGSTGPEVLGDAVTAQAVPQAEVLGSVTQRGAGGVLARTGVELLTLAGFGAALTTAGVAARRAGRDRTS